MRRLRLLVPVLAALVAACGGGSDAPQMHGTLERDRNERIVELHVSEGDAVTTGDLLLRQEAGTMQARLDQARAAVVEAERRLADAVAGPRQREMDEARAALGGADSSLATEQKEYERIDALVERKLLSASSRDQARARRDMALAARDEARARLRLLEEGTRPEQVRQARAAVDRARASLAELETSAARYEVRAPRDGRVEALPYRLGERPPAGAPVVVMLADGVPYARIYVPEPLRAQVTAGQAVDLTMDGVDGVLHGVIRYVSAEAAYTPYYALTQKDRTRLSFLAEVVLDDPRAASLPVGLPVQVTLAAAPSP
jgi:HlyD family secretion protein